MNEETDMTTSTSSAVGGPLAQAAGAADFKVLTCILCGFLYDEAQGVPEMGIAPGTRWADVPDTFVCPDCSATKADFEMVEI
jgi:rubredoxin